MIRRIDHVITVVEDVERTCARLLALGCPLVWDGRSGAHRDVLFSIGPVRLELLAAEAFDGWPALAELAAHSDRSFGVRVAALDPGDLDQTVAELRRRGIAASDPQDGALEDAGAKPGGGPIARWRNAYVDGLRGLLPGLPSFLCQILATPQERPGTPASRGPTRAEPAPGARAQDVPLQFVELRVGVEDPERAASTYERVLDFTARPAADGSGEIVVPLATTPIRLVPGDRLQLVLTSTAPEPSRGLLEPLAAELPGVRWMPAVGHQEPS